MGTEESIHSLRNLVLLISSLTSCGFQELRPSSIVYEAPFQQPGFTLPQPTGKGKQSPAVPHSALLSAESQKGINAIQWCSVENQKGTIAIDFVQW